MLCMDHFVYAPSQWEMMLHCNTISHWLGAYTKWAQLWDIFGTNYLPNGGLLLVKLIFCSNFIEIYRYFLNRILLHTSPVTLPSSSYSLWYMYRVYDMIPFTLNNILWIMMCFCHMPLVIEGFHMSPSRKIWCADYLLSQPCNAESIAAT